MASLQLKLLGGFAARLASGQAIDVSGKKNQALLAYLALNPGRTLPREKLVGLLWSDRGDAQARGSLRQALAALRRDLAEADPEILITRGDTVAIAPSGISTDVAKFERLAASTTRDDLRQAAALYEGDLMDGTAERDPAYDEWVSVERGRLREIAISTLTRLSRQQSGTEAVTTATHLIALDPLREASHRALMEIHAAQGQRDQAIRQYQTCREVLRRELSLEPSPETEDLYRQISEGNYRQPASGQQSAAIPEATSPSVEVPSLSLVDKPSIAVLPFTNMSGDAEQDYLTDGITENITNGLSRFRDLFVIARDSTFTYKGKAVKVQDVSRELGVRYVLGGSAQWSRNGVRISAHLVDGATGGDLWAERYDRGAEDILAVQDEVTQMIVGALATSYGGRLRKAWQRRGGGAGPQDLQAIDYFQRGQQFLNHFTREDTERAREYFAKAAELDPGYAKPWAKMSMSHLVDAMFGWSKDPAESWARVLEYAKIALERDDDEAWGHWALAGYYHHLNQYDRAIAEYQKALELNPNDADVLTDYGWCLNYAGRHLEGLEMALKAMRLNPHFPDWYVMQLGQIYFDARQYEKAIATFDSLPNLETILIRLCSAASHANLGHAEAARYAVRRALELDPQATVSRWASPEMAQYNDPKDLKHFRDSLRKAGLPE